MSLDPILWALKDAPVVDVYERAVLTVLAETADDDGCDAYPSVKTIAKRAMCNPRQVSRVLADLRERGLLALGDQESAKRIDPRYRPTVYDVMIPYSWFPNVRRINDDRADKGLPPLTPESRPDIGEAPERQRRSDFGKPKKSRSDSQSSLKKPQVKEGGLSVIPTQGVTDSSVRGDYKVSSGVTSSHTNHPYSNLPLNHPSSAARQGTETGQGEGSSVDGGLVGGQKTPTPGAVLLASLPQAPGVRFVKDMAPAVDALIESGWTAHQLSERWTVNTRGALNPLGLLRDRIGDTPPKQSAKAAVSAEQRVASLARQGETGAREACRVLGLPDWREPERGDQDARTYLLETKPKAAASFVEAHRAELIAALA